MIYNQGATAGEIGKDTIGYSYYDTGNDEWTAGTSSVVSTAPRTHFLGSHNYYYWHNQGKLLARMADGSSFKFFDFNAVDEIVEQQDFHLLRTPGVVTVPIVFDGDVAFIYASGASTDMANPTGFLRAHVYN